MSTDTDELKPKLDEDPNIVIPFYHGRISHEVAAERLERNGKEGGYLFRKSDLRTGVFILSSISKGSVSHIIIPQNGKRRQPYHEAVGKMQDLVNLSEVYCHPVISDPLVYETDMDVYVKSENTFGCSCCKFIAGSKGDLDNHLKNLHKVKKCFDCMTYIRPNVFKYHEKVCNKKTSKDLHREVMCDICKFKTIHESSLRRHRKIHEIKPFICQSCKSLFKTEDKWRIHECSFSDIRFKCKYCEKILSSSSALNRHIKQKNHIVDTIKRPKGRTCYKCEQCPFKTHDRKALPRHKNHKHTEKKKTYINCKFCDYKSTWPSRMKKHRLKHKAMKPVIVSIIGDETICMK